MNDPHPPSLPIDLAKAAETLLALELPAETLDGTAANLIALAEHYRRLRGEGDR